MRYWFSLAVFWCATVAQTAPAADTGYVYAYFKGGWSLGGHSGIFLSYSKDGLHFESMNGGNAVFVPPTSWGLDSIDYDEDQTRDPSLVRGPDGLYHMVWTSGITTRSIGYASSPNLKDWTAELLDVWEPSVSVANTWAPEIFYNDTLQKYQIVFASNLNNGHHKLYSITTTDFTSYTTPEVFYYNGNTVIDGMIAKDVVNNRYLLALKDERGGERNISIATSADASPMSWTTNNPVIVGPGSAIEPNATEGPTLLKIDNTWFLYYDAYNNGYLGLATTTATDPRDPNGWANITAQTTMPVGPSAHHGTVIAAQRDSFAFSLLLQSRSDLNKDAQLDLDDWLIFSQYHLADLSGLTASQQAARGDLNGDGKNNFYDFFFFGKDFDYLNGLNTFQAMLATVSVPEPSSAMLALLAGSLCLRRHLRSCCPVR